MSTTTYKKGDILFREGDKITSILVIQSGGVSLCLLRPKKNVEIMQLGAAQVLGEQALSGAAQHALTAIATAETKVLELPVESLKTQIEGMPQPIRILTRSLTDRVRNILGELRSYKLEKDPSPCPEDQTAKVFGAIYHTALHKGEKEKDFVKLDWNVMKQYAQRVFGESPKRLEQAISIFVKLKLAQFEFGKSIDNPTGPDELQGVKFFDLQQIENFFEFYQYYYFKGGKTEFLKVDDLSLQIVKGFLKFSVGQAANRHGVVTLDYGKTIDQFKSELNINMNPDHFARLEMKGVFIKRKSMTDGAIVLEFEVKELQKIQYIWLTLKEIVKWNEKGFVDLNEEEAVKAKAASANACPSCSVELQESAKFCSECGFKIAA